MIAEGDAQTGGRVRVQEKGGGRPCHQKGVGGKSKSGQWVVVESWYDDDTMDGEDGRYFFAIFKAVLGMHVKFMFAFG